PVGGIGTRAVLTGHRGLATSELFTNLDKVQIGDTFTIEVFGEVLTYQVVTTEVVEPEDSKALYPDPDRDLVTLVTCTPLGINSHRILVTGQRILPTPAEDLAKAGAVPTIPGFPWWAVILGAVLVLGALYVWLSGRAPRRTRRAAARPAPSDEDAAPAP
ncbi:class C sortase, partial [Schumannella luteola]